RGRQPTDFKDQHHQLIYPPQQTSRSLAGVLLTHAHIGHYTGLMHLGREAMGAQSVPVYAMPRLVHYLQNNGPWSQLVDLQNIQLKTLQANHPVQLNEHLQFTPILVPHRDEFSETVGFLLEGQRKRALFIPDIDKWQLWDHDIRTYIQQVDYAFLDGTFFENGEIPGRDISEIPHPFIEESLQLLADLPASERAKVHFIHFNHTNPILQPNSTAKAKVLSQGFRIAEEVTRFLLD
ncbi:MAG: MBL fold metallo-hydrolase, partial [Bacteroidota bacterium]